MAPSYIEYFCREPSGFNGRRQCVVIEIEDTPADDFADEDVEKL